ncbi:hypothetical protein [Streptomyces longisporoflavus]|uniref:Integral membrane protein n=1 Tax=Streptomyces longisporoflavus TaxID=28044 RepID=A0ABW7R1K9_9ACTN
MFLQPQLKTLMRDGSRGAELHDARNLQKSWRKFAAFAYVAEQYGYRYDGLSPTSPKESPNPYFAFRRTPDAVERAARTAALFPQALTGGQLPGMRPGGSRLRPLPEAQRAVDLLHARIQVDYAGSHRRRGLLQLLVIPLALLIPLSQTGFTLASVLVCAGIWVFFIVLWAVGLFLARRRFTKYARLLQAAAVQWPPRR